eukprot:scaffold239200_cov29-Prasinocladus_malaysianus.AAC.1
MKLSQLARDTSLRVLQTTASWLAGDHTASNVVPTLLKAFPALAGATIGRNTRGWKSKAKTAEEFADATAVAYLAGTKGTRAAKAFARRYLKGWEVTKAEGFYACLVHEADKRAVFACRGTPEAGGLDMLADAAILAVSVEDDPRFQLAREECARFAASLPEGHTL